MSQEMDELFSYFLKDKGFGPAIETKVVSQRSLEKFKGKLPDQLLLYWREYGWSGYGKGLFWLVDPDEYEPVLEAWIGDTPFMEQDAYYVIARSAFGELFLWGTKNGPGLSIESNWGMIFPGSDAEAIKNGQADQLVKNFIAFQKVKNLDMQDSFKKPLFDRALEKLGPLAADEMYGFVPALALGGKADLKNLQKVKAVEHLVMLAQLGDHQIMRDIVKDAKAAGLM